MAENYDSCPNCGYVPRQGALGGMLTIWACNNCDTRFCYKCPGSDNDAQCPNCGNGSRRRVGLA